MPYPVTGLLKIYGRDSADVTDDRQYDFTTMADTAHSSVNLAFSGSVITNYCVQIFILSLGNVWWYAYPPALTNPADMQSTTAGFVGDLTAASISVTSEIIAINLSSGIRGQNCCCPIYLVNSKVLAESCQSEHAANLLRCSYSYKRHFSVVSCIVFSLSWVSVSKSLTSLCVFLLSFFLRHASTSCFDMITNLR